jgi:hypothetical protein
LNNKGKGKEGEFLYVCLFLNLAGVGGVGVRLMLMVGMKMIKNELGGWYEVTTSLNRQTPWTWINTCKLSSFYA